MRLIDADVLLKGKTDHEMISTHLIWNAPTVEAIPIEWLEQFGVTRYQKNLISNIIGTWREEAEDEDNR